MADCYVGEIRLFAGNFAPDGWLLCDGTQYPNADYEVLNAVLGTLYGGTATTFAVPDLRGRLAIGAGQGPGLQNRGQGQPGGALEAAITTAHTPAHAHPLKLSKTVAPNPPVADCTGKTFGVETLIGSGRKIYGLGTNVGAMASGSVSLNQAGPALPHSNIQPYLPINYIIAWNGLFPQRP